MMSLSSLKKWGIYLAKFYFDDKDDIYKVRPVLIIDNFNLKVLVLKMTSNFANEPNFIINDYKSHGLNSETTILTNCIYSINSDNVFADKHLEGLTNDESIVIEHILWGDA